MTHVRRLPCLASLLAAVALLLAPAVQPAFAQDDRDFQRLTREIQRNLNNARVSDESLAEQINRLTAWPTVETARFLIQTVLPGIADARRVDRSGVEPTVVDVLKQIAAQNEEAAALLTENTFDASLPEDLRFRLIEAQVRDGGAGDAFLQRGLGSENWATRVLLLNYLARHGTINDETFQAVRACLFHADRRVRTSAARAVERLCAQARTRSEREIACFEALIELLERERSGLKRDVMRMLEGLTRRQLGDEPGPWRVWLNAYRAGTAPDIDDSPAATGVRRDYYDIELPKKMIFVVDLSSSMMRPISDKDRVRERLERGGPRGYDWDNTITLLDLARAELIRAIESLSEPSRRDRRDEQSSDGNEPVGDGEDGFTIIAYSDSASAWREHLVAATAPNKRQAANWVRSPQGRGLTNIYEAFDLAFRIAGERRRENRGVTTGGPPQPPETAAEAIFFLTDGYGTTGKYHHNSVDMTFRRLDSNNDNNLSWDEYLAAFDLEFIEERPLREYFDRHLDANRDGNISREELQGAEAWFYGAQMDNLVAEFSRRNEMMQLKIHCIGIGAHDSDTLSQLARRNNGTYINLGPQ